MATATRKLDRPAAEKRLAEAGWKRTEDG